MHRWGLRCQAGGCAGTRVRCPGRRKRRDGTPSCERVADGSPAVLWKVPGPDGRRGDGSVEADTEGPALTCASRPARLGGERGDQVPVVAPAISFRSGSWMGGTAFWRPGSQESQAGRYQLRSPRRDIAAGMRMPRTTVASMSTAAAIATPNILNSISDSVAKMENTATMITAALVTTPALPPIPPVIAWGVLHPRCRSSRMRDRMNTW